MLALNQPSVSEPVSEEVRSLRPGD